MEFIIIIVGIYVYKYAENKKTKREFSDLNERYEVARKMIDEIYHNEMKNKERIGLSKITFDNIDYIIIEDILDIGNDRGINVYLLVKNVEFCNINELSLLLQRVIE